MNKIILVGNIVRDIELKYLPSGSAVATTGIATNKKFKKQDGSQGEEVMFIDLSFFGRGAEIANQYLTKGSKVAIEGSLKLDSWTDQSGQKRSKHSVRVGSMEMVGSKQDGAQKQPVKVEQYNQGGQKVAEYDMPSFDVNDDELPFSGGTR